MDETGSPQLAVSNQLGNGADALGCLAPEMDSPPRGSETPGMQQGRNLRGMQCIATGENCDSSKQRPFSVSISVVSLGKKPAMRRV